MTNQQILEHAARMSYPHLNIESGCCVRSGRESWEVTLPLLTQAWREKLVAKLVARNREQEEMEFA